MSAPGSGIRFSFIDPAQKEAATAAVAAAASALEADGGSVGAASTSVEGDEAGELVVPGGPVVVPAVATHENTRLLCIVPNLGPVSGRCAVEVVLHADGGAVAAMEEGWEYEGGGV